MKSSFCKLIVVVILSTIMFHVYTYLFNSFISVDYARVTYKINPHLINVVAFIKMSFFYFAKTLEIYAPFTIISLLIYVQTSLHRSWLKTLCFLLVYPLLAYLSAHIIYYAFYSISYTIVFSTLASALLQLIIYTLFILLIAVIYSKLARLKADSLFENDRVNKWVQSLLYSLLFAYFIWQITSNTLSYNFFINYYQSSAMDSLVKVLTFFYTLFILAYLVLWTYPQLSTTKQKNNFIRLAGAFFIICTLWGVVITILYQTDIIYDLMRWFTGADEYKKSIILFLVYFAFIFFMRNTTFTGVHYLLCFIITFLVVVTLNKQSRDISPLALQLSYITVCTALFYIMHSIAFRIAFYEKKAANKEPALS